MERVDVVIAGAGVIGLAIASRLSKKYKKIIVIEKHPSFGQESSSRNSEVIHAGIYYKKDSLKAKFCVEGKELLYEFCKKKNIPHKRIGKLIVATSKEELEHLKKLIRQANDNGVNDLRLISGDEVKKIEPHVEAISAIVSPSTGIIDTHKLMSCLESLAKDEGVIFAYNCLVHSIKKEKDRYQLGLKDADGEELSLIADIFINSAGLDAERVASMVGIDTEKAGYKLNYSKGEYFRVANSKSKLVSKLIYPTPKNSHLGIHTVADLRGQLKLGPSAFLVDEINYDVEALHAGEFYEATKKFLPFITLKDLSPDTAGIRPKIKTKDNETKDFIISNEEEKTFPNFINLVGIDSPGLTASLPIAKYVESIIQ